MNTSIITIDGSQGEGGGQILRTSLTLSVLTGRPFEIINIRAGRSRPGLQPQHLSAVRSAARICEARLEGDRIGSQTLRFEPRSLNPPEEMVFDVAEVAPSAGSVSLIFQTVLLPLTFCGRPVRLTLKGGTDVPFSPPFSYIREVFLPTLMAMGLKATYALERAGFYPRGGGCVHAEIQPLHRLNPIVRMERGQRAKVEGVVFSSQLPGHISERQKDQAQRRLKAEGLDARIILEERPSLGPGTGILLKLISGETIAGFSALGAIGKRAEKVADEACDALISHWRTGALLDPHMADQLILPIALASGRSAFTTGRFTDHLRTNIAIVRQWLGVDLQGEEIPPVRVEAEGIGFAGKETGNTHAIR